ncbi:MAG: GNAT family N-acetyltransferase [Clostridia bacterium]|nr:GNAT family N-acetyltransferase [Clostridia bacterium]
MHTIETERLLLRPFEEKDYGTILSISSDPESVKYLYFWGLNGMTPEQDAHRFLNHTLKEWQKTPVTMREYCVVLKATGEPIGDASVEVHDATTAEIGWILLPAYRGQGYATEAGRAMMDFGFTQYHAQRVIAHCDARNAPSYHVMERLGMTLDGIQKEARPAKTEGGVKGDEATYGISREDWAWRFYHGLNGHFDGFMALPDLTDGDIRLVCQRKRPAEPERNRVPGYEFLIARGSERLGEIRLRIGNPDFLFYCGHIGYSVDEAYRGQGIAGRACRLLRPVMRYHGMTAALITNDIDNLASRRVCEKLGCTFLCRARIPDDHEMRLEDGEDAVNVFAFPAEEG